MVRNLRTLFVCSLLATSAILLAGPFGCAGPDNNNNNGGESKVGQACTATTDCGTGEVCDDKAKICFKECTDDSECDPGNKCDATLKRCACDTGTCTEDNVTDPGCHPVKNVCESKCTSDDDCTDPAKCLGADGNKFCTNPAGRECSADADCKDATKPRCDTAKGVCIPPADSCTTDAECTDQTKPKCDTTASPKACVECLVDADCPQGKTCDTATKACVGPAACTDTPTCNTAAPKGYCAKGNETAGCQEASNCTDPKSPIKAEQNSNWEAQIANREGTITWGAEAKMLKGNDPTGQGCKGYVEVRFKFYNDKAQFAPTYFSFRTHAGTRTAGQIYEKPSVVTEKTPKKEGAYLFTMCFKADASGKFPFWVSESGKGGKQSNVACYSF